MHIAETNRSRRGSRAPEVVLVFAQLRDVLAAKRFSNNAEGRLNGGGSAIASQVGDRYQLNRVGRCSRVSHSGIMSHFIRKEPPSTSSAFEYCGPIIFAAVFGNRRALAGVSPACACF
jgi:hypothetical protein